MLLSPLIGLLRSALTVQAGSTEAGEWGWKARDIVLNNSRKRQNDVYKNINGYVNFFVKLEKTL